MKFMKPILRVSRKLLNVIIMALFGFLKLRALYTFIYSRAVRLELSRIYKSLYENSKKRNGMFTERDLFLIRRNTHRLEKGLLMQPRREIFALDYIEEHVNLVIIFMFRLNNDQIKWACEVLDQYFSVTDSSSKRYVKAKTKFYENYNRTQIDQAKPLRIPYQYVRPNNDHRTLTDLLRNRKSVRWYEKSKVPHEVLIDAVEHALMSPSSCNRQAYRYYATTNFDDAEKIANISGGTGGWAHNIPAILVLTASQDLINGPEDMFTSTIDASLSVLPLILRLEEKGYATCIINWVGTYAREKKIRSVLPIKDSERVVLSIAVGKASIDGEVASSIRKDVECTITILT